jgi:hypothetical protein
MLSAAEDNWDTKRLIGSKMSIVSRLNEFRTSDTGAVTVDWVVLTAAVVGLGLAVMTAIATSTNNVLDTVDTDLAAATSIPDQIAAD